MTRAMARRAALALTVTATAAAAALAGLATAAKPAPAVRVVTASGFELAFSRERLVVPTGRPVRLTLRNRSDFAHNIALRGPRLAKRKLGPVVGRGGTSTIRFANLRPGTYTFFCSVGGHDAAGMNGKLIVPRPKKPRS